MIRLRDVCTISSKQVISAALEKSVNCSQIILPTSLHDVYQSLIHSYTHYYRRVNFYLPDGMPIKFLASSLNHKKIERGYGPSIIREVEKARITGNHVYIGNVQKLKTIKHTLGKYVALPFKSSFVASDLHPVISHLSKQKMNIIWILVSSPKQVQLAYLLVKMIPQNALIICIGGGYELIEKPTPEFMKTVGFEWLYRLVREPRRLWKRYLLFSPIALLFLIIDYCFSFQLLFTKSERI